ncbi:MAG: hypothetical protein ACRD5H_10900 [Nitrososphaerales archaeon]
MIKKNVELLPTDTSLDGTFNLYGAEADAHIDSILGNGIALTTVPVIVTHAASNYAAGRYLLRVKEDSRGKSLIDEAEKQVREYKKSVGRVTVFG